MTNKFIAIVCESVREVHAATEPTGTYGSLCGLDAEENLAEDPMDGEKITCPQCRAIWQAAKRYRASDFASAIPSPRPDPQEAK